MKVDIPFGVSALEIGAITVYTLKLRFNNATYSWIKPELDSCDSACQESIRVTEHNGYTTIRLETTFYSTRDAVWLAIQRGQIAQQEYMLEYWREHGFRIISSSLYAPSAPAVDKTNLV